MLTTDPSAKVANICLLRMYLNTFFAQTYGSIIAKLDKTNLNMT